MCLAQLFLQSEAAYDCVNALGELVRYFSFFLTPRVSSSFAM
jgi:hypothetical protein